MLPIWVRMIALTQNITPKHLSKGRVAPPLFFYGDNMKVKRGIKYLIPKQESEVFREEAKIYKRNINLIIPKVWEFLQQLISKYGAKNVLLEEQFVIITTDDTEVVGFDGKVYEFSQNVSNRSKGRQTWFTLSQQKPSDIIDNPKKKKLKDTQLCKMCQSLLPSCKPQYVFDLYQYSYNRITSRKRQAKGKSKFSEYILNNNRPPKIRNDGIHSPRKLFSIKDGVISYQGHAGEIKCRYNKIIGPGKEGTIGGNFSITRGSRKKHDVFVIATEFDISFDYNPLYWVGFDINKEYIYWIVFYNNQSKKSWIWELGEHGRDILERRAELNKQIDNAHKANLKSKQRSKLRIKVVKHIALEQERYIRKCWGPFLQQLKETHGGLAIDNIQPGAGSGSFFQDTIRKIVPKMCEEMGIPYTMVKPAYTSVECSNCGNRATQAQKKKMIKDNNMYKCEKCGYEEVIHVNAAKNITKRGEENYAS